MCKTRTPRSQAAKRAFGAGARGRGFIGKVAGEFFRVLARRHSFDRVKGFRSVLREGSGIKSALTASASGCCLGLVERPQFSAEVEFVGAPSVSVVGLALLCGGSVFGFHP